MLLYDCFEPTKNCMEVHSSATTQNARMSDTEEISALSEFINSLGGLMSRLTDANEHFVDDKRPWRRLGSNSCPGTRHSSADSRSEESTQDGSHDDFKRTRKSEGKKHDKELQKRLCRDAKAVEGGLRHNQGYLKKLFAEVKLLQREKEMKEWSMKKPYARNGKPGGGTKNASVEPDQNEQPDDIEERLAVAKRKIKYTCDAIGMLKQRSESINDLKLDVRQTCAVHFTSSSSSFTGKSNLHNARN
jgi:hypothetical protein